MVIIRFNVCFLFPVACDQIWSVAFHGFTQRVTPGAGCRAGVEAAARAGEAQNS